MIQRVFILQTSALISPRTIYWPIKTSTSLSFKFFTSGRHCTVDTELIDRENNAINCINCFWFSTEVYGHFPSSFTFQFSSGQWCRCTENRMFAFSEFQQHFVRDFIPSSLWTCLCRKPLLFRTWSQQMTIVQHQSFSEILWRLQHFPNFLLYCLFCHKRCYWTLTWKEFFLWMFLVFRPQVAQ